MSESSPEDGGSKRSDFFCGVVEGFYGRPWTTEQRKDLFQKLKKWNMDMYVYAPKDDYKHRAYWRELYTVEEAEHLTSLITAAKEQGITFCYALSPGLDITYSSQKEITILKRKLDQVAQFGCTCFALLFDDIEPDMSEADKQIFQTFAHAQVSVTNEVQQHLGCVRFLLCPTQYCATRASPAVHTSEYLNTLGTKLSQQIDVMWTGSKVISKTLTTECIEEITQVLRRPPVIWDNLHANDYDQKRIFLGPYCGRSPSLIPLLRGVLSNPNIEYNANLPAVRTLAHWATCSRLATPHSDAVSWDIKLEREGEQGVCDDEPLPSLNTNVYHPRQALRQAIEEWLPEFSIPKSAQDPVIKPQPPVSVAPVPILPILPSVNTCMSLTASTTSAAIPTVRANMPNEVSQAETVTVNSVTPVMNSLVSPTKVVVNESIPNPIIPLASSNISIPSEIPVSSLPIPVLGMKNVPENGKELLDSTVFVEENMMKNDDKFYDDQIIVDDDKERNGDMSVGDTPPTLSPSGRAADVGDVEVLPDVAMTDGSENGSMQVETNSSPLSGDMMVETSECAEMPEVPAPQTEEQSNALTTDDLVLMCDLFYLPFEHGSRALRLLHDYHWLVTHCNTRKTDPCLWSRRLARWTHWASQCARVARRLAAARNGELRAELRPYLLDLCAVLATLRGLLRWIELGKFPANAAAQTQSCYTWFSKGWREAFESGAQEPWVFRGGVISELRRLLPADCVDPPATGLLDIRLFTVADDQEICELCRQTCCDGNSCGDLFPSDLRDLPSDRLIQPFLTLSPEFCMLIEDVNDCPGYEENMTSDCQPKNNGVKPQILSYVCGALDCKDFYMKQELAWIPEMREKYGEALLERDDLSPVVKDCIREFHTFSAGGSGACAAVCRRYPSLALCGVRASHSSPSHRLLAVLMAALKVAGSTGVHVCISNTDAFLHSFYTKVGFTEVMHDGSRIYLGRSL